jgi:hypothetical protein
MGMDAEYQLASTVGVASWMQYPVIPKGHLCFCRSSLPSTIHSAIVRQTIVKLSERNKTEMDTLTVDLVPSLMGGWFLDAKTSFVQVSHQDFFALDDHQLMKGGSLALRLTVGFVATMLDESR